MEKKIVQVQERTQQLIRQLLNVWESSVRATHDFLSEEEIIKIREYVPMAIENVEYLIIAEKEFGEPVAFMGIDSNRLEMLFLSLEVRGKGLGKQLLQYGIETYNIQELTCEQLRIHFGTGRSIYVSGTGRDKKFIYRSGCMTDIGDILEADWFALARYIIERDGEQVLYEGLVEYAKTCAWLHSKVEREEYALQLHMSRMFDEVEWVGYQEFNNKHRPWILQGDEKGEAQCECESKLPVTAEKGCSNGQIA